MKIVFEWPFKAFSGTLQELTYQSCRNGNLCLGRKWEMPDITANNARLGRVAKNLKSIWDSASPAYKEDIKQYARLFKAQKLKAGKCPPAAYSIYVKMMYGWQRTSAVPVDLANISMEDLVKVDAPVRSVAKAVMAQLLTPVKGYQRFSNEI